MAQMTKVPGANKGSVTLYALSTRVWCKRTKALLDAIGAQYEYVYVDLLAGEEKAGVSREVLAKNPQGSYPTLVINGKVIAGFREEEIRELLK